MCIYIYIYVHIPLLSWSRPFACRSSPSSCTATARLRPGRQYMYIWPCATFRGVVTRHSCSIPFPRVSNRVWIGVWKGVWSAMACRRPPITEIHYSGLGTQPIYIYIYTHIHKRYLNQAYAYLYLYISLYPYICIYIYIHIYRYV